MENKFIKSTFILMIGGFITKVLGFIIKLVYTRIMGDYAVSLYSLILPTYSLLITIATMAMPLAISKLVAEKKTRSLKILFSSVVIMVVVNIIMIVTMFAFSKFIAFNLLKNKETYLLLLACTITLPFISISSIVKGYFFGKQRMLPYALSNSLEQILRLILIILVLPHLIKKSILIGIIAFILLNIISEIFSVIIFMFFIPKKVTININKIKPDLKTIKNVLGVSMPTVSSRFIGNIGFFFEPIILTNILLLKGYSSEFIMMEYGAYNAYSIALLSMPNFFVGAISSSLVPEISKFYENKNMKMVKRRFKQALIFSFFLGLSFSIIIFIFRDNLLSLLYNTTNGSDYIKVLAPFFVLFYLESPIISTLQAIGKSKFTMKITFFGVIIKTLAMAVLSLFKIGIYGLVISEIINIIFVVGLNYKEIKKSFN